MVGAHQYRFSERLLVINNVTDPAEAEWMAGQAIARGELDRYVFVHSLLENALNICGLTVQKLGKLHYYSDFAFVELYATRTQYMLHQDAEVNLRHTFDWVTPGLEKLAAKPNVLVVNPSWSPDPHVVLGEGFARDGDYVVAYGFSDQIYLTRRDVLLAPVYGRRHLASLRYPLAARGPIFETWVDSLMRRRGLLRLTDLRIQYRHVAEGESYPRDFTFKEKVRRRVYARLAPVGMSLSAKEGSRTAKRYFTYYR